MTENSTPRDVDALLDNLLAGEDPALTAALAASDAAGLPPIAVSAQQGKFLNLLATAVRATRILEIGTLGGYSTIWLARAVGPHGLGGDAGVRAQARGGRARQSGPRRLSVTGCRSWWGQRWRPCRR